MFQAPPSLSWVVEIEKAARTAPLPLHICDEGVSVVRRFLAGQEARGAYPPGAPTQAKIQGLIQGHFRPSKMHLEHAPDSVFRSRARLLVLPSSLTLEEYHEALDKFDGQLFVREQVRTRNDHTLHPHPFEHQEHTKTFLHRRRGLGHTHDVPTVYQLDPKYPFQTKRE